jgi:hypothetical protein
MPKTVKPFMPCPQQLTRGIEHICYEYANLMSAAHWDMKGSAPWRTHADDAFLLGYRKLGDFLLNQHRSKKLNGQELPDILALDYLPSGYAPNWTLPVWTSEWRNPMNKQLTHLSYIRDKAWVHYDWVPRLEEEFRIAWQKFRRAIDPKYKRRFAAEITKCRHKQGFAGIKL